MVAEIIHLEHYRLQRRASQADCDESILPWGSHQWPLCRIRCFTRTTLSQRPPRCCCGKVYGEATLRARATVLTAITRDTVRQLGANDGLTMSALVAALLVRPELTSVERAALSTGPCASCPTLAEQTQQIRFLWGLYRAYWGRAAGSRACGSQQSKVTTQQSRQSAIDLRGHIRQEIALIRLLRQRLALCPWARRRPMSRSAVRPPGC